ncbi:MAG: radical SAM protein [Patescibacteria group bacterium]|jgi:MoaA/NifB/PqqE/SkfB family radical SAM enzyme
MISAVRVKKYIRIGFNRITQDLATRFFLLSGIKMPNPKRAYYFMTSKCNFQCGMCPQWKIGLEEKAEEYISESRMLELMDEMAGAGIKEIGFSGGEPLIYSDKLLRLLAHASRKGMYTHVATNGSLITREFLGEYDKIGGGHISLSIDALGERHNELRGFGGAFSGTENVLKLFETNNYRNILLKINLTLTGENLGEAPAVVKMAATKNAVVFIQPYDPYDYAHSNDAAYLESHYPLWVKKKNYGELEKSLDEIMEIKRDSPEIILNSEEHLADIKQYFQGRRNIKKICFSGLDQISIFPRGEIMFCKYGVIGDLKNASLKEFLASDKRKEAVISSLSCPENCLLGCMYRPRLGDMLKSGLKQLYKLSKVN